MSVAPARQILRTPKTYDASQTIAVTTAVVSVLLFLGAGWVTRLVGQLAEGVR